MKRKLNTRLPKAVAKWIGQCPRRVLAPKSAPLSVKILIRSTRPAKIKLEYDHGFDIRWRLVLVQDF